MKTVPTFTATIYVGLEVRATGKRFTTKEALAICQRYCDDVGLCVSVTRTRFVYTKGSEPGVAVGLINYPRFPVPVATIKALALELAGLLREGLRQLRVSVVFPDETVMLGDDPLVPCSFCGKEIPEGSHCPCRRG